MQDTLKFVNFMFDEGDLISLRPTLNWTDDDGKKASKVLWTGTKTFTREEFPEIWGSHLDFCNSQKANAYYGVCPRFGRREDKTSFEKRWQIRKANFFWLDVDHITPEDAVVRITEAGVPEPSVVVSTGNGVHLYWRLATSLNFVQEDPPVLNHKKINDKQNTWYVDEFGDWQYFVNDGIKWNDTPTPSVCEDALMVEDINCGLGKLLDGDNTNDVSRILRLPGTFNYKDKEHPRECKIFEFSGKTYSIEDFDFALKISPSRKRREAEAKMELPEATITGTKLGKKRERRLEDFLNDLRIVDEGERSDVDWKLICWAVEEGIDPEFIWSKVSDLSKFAARGRRYFDTTLNNARSAVKAKKFEEARERKVADEAAKIAEQTGELANQIPVSQVTDAKIAEFVSREHEGKIVYCHDVKGWWAYTGGRFTAEKAEVVVQRSILSSVRSLPDILVGDDKIDVVLNYEAGAAIAAVEKLVRRMPETAGALSGFDTQHNLLNLTNGTLDLTGNIVKFREHNAGDMLTKQCNVGFDRDAACPTWEAFLRKILVDPETREPSPELYDFMQVYLGTFLTGMVETQTIGIFWGSGQNGKSTLTETLSYLLGDYATNPHSDLLLKKRGNATGQASPEMMTLRGARFVACQEMDKDKELDESGVKLLTGGDTLTARPLFGSHVSWEPTHQIILATNNKPVITGGNVGIWRRIRLIPFAYKVSDLEKDDNLKLKLKSEAAGILNWLIAGLQRFRKEGLMYPDIVEVATKNFKDDSDIVGRFLDERCKLWTKGAAMTKVAGKDLLDAFTEYAQENKEEILGRNTFYQKLEEKGHPGTMVRRVKFFYGIRLMTEEELEIQDKLARGEDIF